MPSEIDPAAPPTPAAAPAPNPTPAPDAGVIVSGAPEPAPSGAAEPAAAVVPPADGDPPAAAPEPAAEAKPHTETPGLLSGESAPDAAAAAQEAAGQGEKTDGGAEPGQPVPLTYEPPTLPDGIQLDGERLQQFDELVGAHQVPPEARQQLVDLFLAERGAWERQALEAQHEAFGRMRADWRQQTMGDQQIGGAGFETSLSAAKRMISLFVPADRRDAFNNMLNITGATDHPEMMRFLVAIARKFDEPAPAPAPRNPPPDIGRRPGTPGRLRDHYDHPTSRDVVGPR